MKSIGSRAAFSTVCGVLMLSGCGTVTPVVENSPRAELDRAVAQAFPADFAKGLVTERDVSQLFGMLRAALDGKDEPMPLELEKKMDKLAEELPAKLTPLMGKILDVAEAEVKRSLPAAPAKP